MKIQERERLVADLIAEAGATAWSLLPIEAQRTIALILLGGDYELDLDVLRHPEFAAALEHWAIYGDSAELGAAYERALLDAAGALFASERTGDWADEMWCAVRSRIGARDGEWRDTA